MLPNQQCCPGRLTDALIVGVDVATVAVMARDCPAQWPPTPAPEARQRCRDKSRRGTSIAARLMNTEALPLEATP